MFNIINGNKHYQNLKNNHKTKIPTYQYIYINIGIEIYIKIYKV
jgi:hypothetical protein